MQVIKNSGESEQFNSRKIYSSIREAGGSSKIAKEAIKVVKEKYYPEITTKEILQIILKILEKEPGIKEKYNLKNAIMQLGPSGFPFEKFISKVLNYYGYETKTNLKLKGKCIYHEVDLVATKSKKYMVECKYHNELGNITKLQVAMYTYARFLDLEKEKFNQPWLITNTKCSEDAKNYARGVNLKITSWKYPEKESLQKLIEEKNLYPITIIENLSIPIKEKMFENDFVVLKDFESYDSKTLAKKLKISEDESENLLNNIKNILR